jgi:Cu-Zn family superoxide dismutase
MPPVPEDRRGLGEGDIVPLVRGTWSVRRVARLVGALAVGGAVVAGGVPVVSVEPAKSSASAEATLRAADGTKVGWASFTTQRDRTYVRVWLNVRKRPGLTALDAFHGLHVHANDVPGNGEGCLADPAQPPATWFVSADGHLTMPARTHGAHAGDLPPVLLDADGTADLKFTTARLALAGLDNRAVVLHAGPDNLGNVPVGAAPDAYTPNSSAAMAKTQATGNAGDRVACGVIRLHR